MDGLDFWIGAGEPSSYTFLWRMFLYDFGGVNSIILVFDWALFVGLSALTFDLVGVEILGFFVGETDFLAFVFLLAVWFFT